MSTKATSPKHVLVSGASGMIGRSLIDELHAHGHRVTRLVRREPKDRSEFRWNPAQRTLDAKVLDGVDAVVNLSGSPLSKLPWTYNVKKEILRSRVNATLTITGAMAASANPPAVLINGSASGAYGDRPGQVLDEDSALPETDEFLPRVVDRWERAAQTAPDGTRVVLARTGLVLGRGGVLTVLKTLASVGLLSQLGDGTQRWPWVSLRDEVRALRHLLESDDAEGAYNLVGPTPATADEIQQQLATELGRPYKLKAPSTLIDLTLQKAGRELFLADQEIRPKRLLEAGFSFKDRTAGHAVELALKSPEFVPEPGAGV
ncbi:TIGR01777 family protein [Pseudoclavibacter sp. AY1F1]|uniref:TIGR01777 family oxidoreductase n=1 Tax=Pseudoclavibacter sp. AY1F1 TaxID=2080583 RepID=UPI000CE8CE21|nr:TIGR01777 family oxidoreductase [Pseudoclavibacter sp. AY1F1]PPF47149.1 TIGR01777 family protein [Pseudoclavibacter sp. AY1F1]